jgi:hypothetical protein
MRKKNLLEKFLYVWYNIIRQKISKGHKMPKDNLESAVSKLDELQNLGADALKKMPSLKLYLNISQSRQCF